ncbi:recA [Symbiodinium sp. CCMP2456]|nr:recA [Symbiodinium sp. CCMP2456]
MRSSGNFRRAVAVAAATAVATSCTTALAESRSAAAPVPLLGGPVSWHFGQWRPVTDAVRGGVSTARLIPSEAGARFQGTLDPSKLKAGFAGVNLDVAELPKPLTDFTGLKLDVAGSDGREYTLLLKIRGAEAGSSYQVRFTPAPEESLEVPFSRFAGFRRGRPDPTAPPLHTADVGTIALQIASNFQEQSGDYQLGLKGLAGVRDAAVYSIVTEELPHLRDRTRLLDKEEGKARDDREGLRRHLEANERMASYLERCSPLVTKHDNAAVGRFLEGLAELGKKDFTDDEVLQLVNMGPIDPLYIFGICEDSDRRFGEKDLQHICGLAQQHLGAESLAPDPESAEEVEQEPAEATRLDFVEWMTTVETCFLLELRALVMGQCRGVAKSFVDSMRRAMLAPSLPTTGDMLATLPLPLPPLPPTPGTESQRPLPSRCHHSPIHPKSSSFAGLGLPLALARRKRATRRICRNIAVKEEITALSTGAAPLDKALGGGLPCGHIVEVIGCPQSGKTSLALSCVAGAQATGRRQRCAIMDMDGCLGPRHLVEMGVSLARDKLDVFKPRSAEEVVSMIQDLTKSRFFDLIVLDSLGSMTSESQLRSDLKDGDSFGASDLTKILSKFFRQAAPMLRQCRTTLLCTNQFRGGSLLFGPKEVPFGGQALGRRSSVRLCTIEPQIREIAGCAPSLQCQVEIIKFAGVPDQRQTATSVEFGLVFGKGASWGGSISDLRSSEHDVPELSV